MLPPAVERVPRSFIQVNPDSEDDSDRDGEGEDEDGASYEDGVR